MKQDKIDAIVEMCNHIIENAKAGKIDILCGVCISGDEWRVLHIAQSDISDTMRAIIIFKDLVAEMEASVRNALFEKKKIH